MGEGLDRVEISGDGGVYMLHASGIIVKPDSTVVTGEPVDIQGKYGILTIDGDGEYSYTATMVGNQSNLGNETLEYMLYDTDTVAHGHEKTTSGRRSTWKNPSARPSSPGGFLLP